MATERTVLVRLKADVSDFKRGMREAADSVDKTNDRTAWLAQSILALGPTLAPIGAAAVPVFTSLAAGMTMAGVAAGTLGLAFNGVQDALKALNKYQLEPTDAHLVKMQETMAAIGPEGADFVRFLDSLGPALSDLSNTARGELFPGMTAGLKDLMTQLPEFKVLVGNTAKTLGDLSSSAGESVKDGALTEFFHYLETDGQRVLSDMGKTLGNFFKGFADMLVAFGPLTNDFSTGLRHMSEDFAAWSAGLDHNQGFQNFLTYVEQSGPKVLDFLGAFINALVEVLRAAAPVGDVMLPVLTDLLKVVGSLADTPIASWLIAAAAAMSIFGRASALLSVTTGGMLGGFNGVKGLKQTGSGVRSFTADLAYLRDQQVKVTASTTQMIGPLTRVEDKIKTTQERVRSTAKGVASAGGAMGLFALQSTGAADAMGLANTTTLALAGSIAGPWGAAIGGAVGGLMDLSSALSGANDDTAGLQKQVALLIASAGPDKIDQVHALSDAIRNLKESDQGWSLGNVVPNIIGNLNPFDDGRSDTEKKRDALKQARSQLQDQIDLMNAAEQHNMQTNIGYQRSIESITAAWHAQRDAAKKTGNQFITLGKDVDNAKVSLSSWIKQLEDQAQALEDFGKNAKTAADRGLRGGLIKALEDAGPAGALRMKQLADGTDAEIARANRAWRRGQQAIKDYMLVVAGVKPVELRVDITQPKTALEALNELLGNVTKPRNIKITTTTSGGLPGLMVIPGYNIDGTKDRDGDPKTGKGHADGGYTGQGGKYEPAGVVHRREFVFSSEATDGNEVFLDGLHRSMRGYAGGGYVGGLPAYVKSELDMKLPHTIKQWNEALQASTKLLEKEKEKRQALLDQAQGVRDSIQSGYRSDLFGQVPTNVWMSNAERAKAGKGDVFSTLTGDTANANALLAAEKKLKAKGLDGKAYDELVSHASLEEVQAFANGPKSDVTNFEKLYNQREKALAAAGNYGADAAYGASLAASRAQIAGIAKMTHAIDRLDGKVDDAVRALKGSGPRRPHRKVP